MYTILGKLNTLFRAIGSTYSEKYRGIEFASVNELSSQVNDYYV